MRNLPVLKKALLLLIATSIVGCADMSKKDWAILGAAIVGAAAVAHYANKGGGGGGAPLTDYQWDWDQYYYNNQLIWSCRGVQTGQFAEHWHCNSLPQTDYRWPNK